MDPKITEILNDLFSADPALKEHEAEIIKIIEEYLKSKPDTKFDKKFAEELRSELMKKAAELKAQKQIKANFDIPAFLTKFSYALAGSALVLVLVAGLTVSTIGGKSGKVNKGASINFGNGIIKLGRNAFAMNIQPGNKNASTLAYGRGGGGGGNESAQSTATLEAPKALKSGVAEGGVAMDSAKMIAPEYTTYKYVYKGEDFTQDLSTVDIYRRTITPSGSKALADYITALNFDLFDLSNFSGSDVQNFTLSQDKEYGYTFTMDFLNNQISIFQNYLKWPRPELDCKDEACYRSLQMTPDQMPSDEEVISIGDEFLASYGIDKTKFGKPSIQKYWESELERATDKSTVYIPQEVTVIYPYVIEGKDVYDESGNPTGLSVGVNVKYKKGSSIYSIAPDMYEKSNYDAITDKNEILKVAEQGGMYPIYYYGGQENVKELELDTPYLALMRFYDYDQKDGKQSELFIPALIFPVKDIPKDYPAYGKKAITVPLAKEIYDKIGGRVGIPEQPMPLSEPSAVEKPAESPAAGSEPAQSAGTEQETSKPEIMTETVKPRQ